MSTEEEEEEVVDCIESLSQNNDNDVDIDDDDDMSKDKDDKANITTHSVSMVSIHRVVFFKKYKQIKTNKY